MKTILIYSGGLDSTVLLYDLMNKGGHVLALSFNYGQRHRLEVDYAKQNCLDLGIPHRMADLRPIKNLIFDSSQTSHDIDVPEGHYTEESMKATVVPNRNMIMLSVAAGWAMSEKAETIAYAAHSGDHAIYPDCRPEFVTAVKLCILLSDWRKVELYAPYVGMTKADIVKRGFNLGVPLERTWSCYKGGIKHCGRCGTCEERKTAFKIARVDDPTDYIDPAVRFDS